jgi:hypothetical protein
MTTIDLLTAYKAHHGGISDYKAAQLLAFSHFALLRRSMKNIE